MSRRAVLLLSAGFLFARAASAGYEPPGPGPEPGAPCPQGDIVIATQANMTFSPSQVTLQPGQTVCIRNDAAMAHNFHVPGLIRCAGNCSTPYNGSDPATGPQGNWVTRLIFDEAGTFNFRCDLHVGSGMTGRIVVQGGGGGGGAGSLSFSSGSYSAGEAAGSATITVRRTGGDDGAVSVSYATANGSASAGSDYNAASGTLNWADGNDDNKTFAVPITNDTADENNETVQLSLSGPTGGATLGSPAGATLTISDNDGGGTPSAPAAPTGLTATADSTSGILLRWTDASNNETQFSIESRELGGTFSQMGTASANAVQYLAGGLDEATYYQFRVRAGNAGGQSPFSNEAGATTDTVAGVPCVADADTLCFLSGRFRVELHWMFADGTNGPGQAVPLADRSGAFYFQNPANLEMLIKMLNGCSLPTSTFWVFYAATTNVRFEVTVTDTQTGSVRTYLNPQGQAALPVQDTAAFETCN